MVRIKTKVNNKQITTLIFRGKWVTVVSGMIALEASTYFEAGQNHLRRALEVQNSH